MKSSPRHAARPGRVLAGAALAVGVAVALVGCAGGASDPASSGAQEVTKLNINYEKSSNSMIYKIADEQGYFADHGLEVSLTNNGSGTQAIPLLINGQVDVVPTGFPAGLAAIAQGIPIVAVAGNNQEYVDPVLGPTYATVAGPGTNITSWKDLEGKTVGMHSAAFGWAEFTKDAVKAAGGNPDSINFVVVPFPNQVQALRDHQVDAITTVQPYVTLAKLNGGTVLGHTQAVALKVDNPVGQVAWMATSFVEAHPDVAGQLQGALQDAADWSAAHPDETRALIVAETGADPSLIAAQPLPRFTSTIDQKSADATVQFLIRWGQLQTAPDDDTIFAPGALG